jgi:hypothetical protein
LAYAKQHKDSLSSRSDFKRRAETHIDGKIISEEFMRVNPRNTNDLNSNEVSFSPRSYTALAGKIPQVVMSIRTPSTQQVSDIG